METWIEVHYHDGDGWLDDGFSTNTYKEAITYAEQNLVGYKVRYVLCTVIVEEINGEVNNG